jgi:hypothetical protein
MASAAESASLGDTQEQTLTPPSNVNPTPGHTYNLSGELKPCNGNDVDK